MTREEKQLLLIDLCGRLPYGVYVDAYSWQKDTPKLLIECVPEYVGEEIVVKRLAGRHSIREIKPYLRPMSSMTEEEEKEIRMLHHCFYREGNGWITAGVFGTNNCGCTVFEMANMLNYLNAHHFDYRGLIPIGLALEALEGMYK